MSHLGTIILLLVCVAMGYVLEPMFFENMHQPSTDASEQVSADDSNESPIAVPPARPTPAPAPPSLQVDISKITPEDFPAKVALLVDYTIADAKSGITMVLKKGTKVKPVRIDGSELVIQPVGLPIESKINVDDTNFKELAVPKMLERLQKALANKPAAPAPPVVEPAPVPDAVPAPPVEPEPAPEPVAKKLDEAAIVALLKADVQAGNVTEFKADQVTVWKAGEDMEFDGDTYQTGRVIFKAETILGVQEHEAIALIENGKVYKWMWAKTKLEMR